MRLTANAGGLFFISTLLKQVKGIAKQWRCAGVSMYLTVLPFIICRKALILLGLC